jgi:hypothetical protein
MLAGLTGLVLTLWVWNSRRRRVVVQRTAPVTGASPAGSDVVASAGGVIGPTAGEPVVHERSEQP